MLIALNLGKVEEAIIILEKLLTLHPLNKNLPLIISGVMVDNNQNPTRVIKLLNSVSKSHLLNPVFYRTLSRHSLKIMIYLIQILTLQNIMY